MLKFSNPDSEIVAVKLGDIAEEFKINYSNMSSQFESIKPQGNINNNQFTPNNYDNNK